MVSTKELEGMANKLRVQSIKSTTAAGSGHPTSCLSCAELISCLFFSEMTSRDDFILSKGHAAPILWAAYAEAGCIPLEDLMTLRRIDSTLEGHPTPKMPLIRVATGSLGQGLSAGVGMALSQKLKNEKGRIYILMGDGECAEGSVWEAANTAAYYNLDNICVLIDVNRLGQSGPTMHEHDCQKYEKKFQAFGWNTSLVDGHCVKELLTSLKTAHESLKPFVIIAKTVKGKGVSFLEDKEGWHGKPLNEKEMEKALQEIGKTNIALPSQVTCKVPEGYQETDSKQVTYRLGTMVATRTAFGNALINVGEANKDIVVIDADVKNSTMTLEFIEKYPDRGVQSFIAEQNMVGMAIGFSAQGFIPFISTFSTFLTRAHDFIRMAMYSMANIKFVGSHVGISIGPDGPSQMGLEDIPMFLSMPNVVTLYPSDATSTDYLVREMAQHQGISYLRTTREKTPVIYAKTETFPIGGLKVIKQSSEDSVLVISAGITLHEALQAYETLRQQGVYVRVIDLYSLQPFDANSLIKNAEECHNKVIVVEDHYCNTLGSLVSSVLGKVHYLCVRDIPRSGPPEKLRELYGIDATAIEKMVQRL